MKKLYSFILLLVFCNCFAQNIKINTFLKDSIAIESDNFVGFDGFGYFYFIKNSVLIKKNSAKTFEYKNLTLGKIQQVDILNPLKIVLVYENFNTIITLDNQLNETYKINLSDLETPIILEAAGMAAQNKFWIYNNLTQKIGLFDYLKNNYIYLTQSFEGNLKYYQTDFNNFYWINEQNKIYSCNVFGKIKILGDVDNFDKIQLIDEEKSIFSIGNQLFYKNLKSNDIQEIKIIDKSFKSFFYKDQNLTIFTAKGITNYKIILP